MIHGQEKSFKEELLCRPLGSRAPRRPIRTVPGPSHSTTRRIISDLGGFELRWPRYASAKGHYEGPTSFLKNSSARGNIPSEVSWFVVA